MTAGPIDISRADILDDLAASRRAAGRVASFFTGAVKPPAGGTEREVKRKGPPEPERDRAESGKGLIGACGPETQDRFSNLLYFEGRFPPHHDHAFLIAPACQIVEQELDRLVATLARPISDRLVAALEPEHPHQAEILLGWAEGQISTTLGIETLVLLALRRGYAQGCDAIRRFLGDHFLPGYVELLCGEGPLPGLEIIRSRYRNPACHGWGRFDASDYTRFARLVVASPRFGSWYEWGPDPLDSAIGHGVLHHHIDKSTKTSRLPRPEVEPSASRRLLVLRSPPGSPIGVTLRPQHAAPAYRTREIAPASSPAGRPFRIGDSVRLEFRATAPCHLALIDWGTSGRVTVLRPNARCRETAIERDWTYFLPALESPEFELALEGLPGPEKVIAIATRAPLKTPLRPGKGRLFRELTPIDIDRIIDEIARLDVEAWAVGQCTIIIHP
jgi:hypothetical protein